MSELQFPELCQPLNRKRNSIFQIFYIQIQEETRLTEEIKKISQRNNKA